jgi:GxxExxY protein
MGHAPRARHGGTEARSTAEDDALLYRVIGAALHVHTTLGPGLLESVYERCLAAELHRVGIPAERQVPIPVRWANAVVGDAFRADLVVAKHVILEIKAVESVTALHKAQVLTYLKLAGMHRGLILNFNALHLRDGIARITNFSVPPPSLRSSV